MKENEKQLLINRSYKLKNAHDSREVEEIEKIYECEVENMKSDHKQLRTHMKNLEEELKRESISYYEKRIEAGGFWEEVWYSHYNIGHAYFHLGEIEKALYYFQT